MRNTMTAHPALRDFNEADAADVNRVALAAFAQFSALYSDWPAMSSRVACMAELAKSAEIIVAEADGSIAGAVAYIAPDRPKAAFFEQQWPILRMLVVDPDHRGKGLGRSLTEECLRRARRDGAKVVALHTSPIMTVALPMYLRMGFVFLRNAPPIHGVPYDVYLMSLNG
jgi:GNAT superfamily N-acetyltransferase